MADITTIELALTLLAGCRKKCVCKKKKKKIPVCVDRALTLVVLAMWYWEEQFGTWVVGLPFLGGAAPALCRWMENISLSHQPAD